MGANVFIFGFTLGIFMRSALLAQVLYYRWLRTDGWLGAGARRGLAAVSAAGVMGEEVGGQVSAGGGDVG